ncbi:MAG: outer membrane beta-barrel protein [Treponema sp.]|jgi:hypothetical protein|nr:outer membrane beta-barrel protein [Treponema sp.]
MLKRILPVFALLGICALSAFSLDSKTANKPGKASKQAKNQIPSSLSAGGRIFYNGIFGISESKWTGYSGDGKEEYFKYAVEPFIYLANGFGIGGFFDAAYVEIGMDLIFGSFKPGYDSFDGDFEMNSTQFGFSILGKYPIALGPVTVFPLAGFDYQIYLSGESEFLGGKLDRDDLVALLGRDYKDLFDAFSLQVGGGLDCRLTDKLYLRGEVLLNFKLDSKYEAKLRKEAKDYLDSFSLFNFGPRISIGMGYKLPTPGTPAQK